MNCFYSSFPRTAHNLLLILPAREKVFFFSLMHPAMIESHTQIVILWQSAHFLNYLNARVCHWGPTVPFYCFFFLKTFRSHTWSWAGETCDTYFLVYSKGPSWFKYSNIGFQRGKKINIWLSWCLSKDENKVNDWWGHNSYCPSVATFSSGCVWVCVLYFHDYKRPLYSYVTNCFSRTQISAENKGQCATH